MSSKRADTLISNAIASAANIFHPREMVNNREDLRSYVGALEAEHAEVEQIRAMLPKWQSMESAPANGEHILVWSKGADYWVASWRLPTRDEPQCETHCVKEWRSEAGRWATPTHWMPLPDPPRSNDK